MLIINIQGAFGMSPPGLFYPFYKIADGLFAITN